MERRQFEPVCHLGHPRLGYSLSLSVGPRGQRSRRKTLEVLSGDRVFQVIRLDITDFQECVETEKISTMNGVTFKVTVPDIWAQARP